MPLFKIKGKSVSQIKHKSFDSERTLQALFENNLDELLSITFVYHEYTTSFGTRIDTLGIDSYGAPVIIEYKKSQNDNVINQAISYLRWLLDHKAEFESLCQKKKIKQRIDWYSPKIICIAESYNKFDLDTASMFPNIDLYSYRLFQDSILQLERIDSQMMRIPRPGNIKKALSQVRIKQQYSMKDHTSKGSILTNELFSAIREKILSIDNNIKEVFTKWYIAYKATTNFVDICVLKNSIYLYINMRKGTLKDPNGIAEDNSKVGHWGNGDYGIRIKKLEEIDKAMPLIRQSYESKE